MKKITVPIDDDLYRRVRTPAAELNTSASALVKKYLSEFAGTKTDFQRRKRLQDEILGRVHRRSFSPGDRLARDDVHDRKRN